MTIRLTDAQTQVVLQRIRTMKLEPTPRGSQWVSHCRTVTATRFRDTWTLRVGAHSVSYNRSPYIDSALDELLEQALAPSRIGVKAEIKEILGC